jgi:hypothetical protein
MRELVVLGFAGRELAEEAHSLRTELDRAGMLHLDGAALATAATTAGSNSCSRCGWPQRSGHRRGIR